MGKRTFSIESVQKAVELADSKKAPPKERLDYQEIVRELYPSIQKMLKNGHSIDSVVDFLNTDCGMDVTHSTFARYYREENKRRTRKSGSRKRRQAQLEPVQGKTVLTSQSQSKSSSTTVIKPVISPVQNQSSEFRDVDSMEL